MTNTDNATTATTVAVTTVKHTKMGGRYGDLAMEYAKALCSTCTMTVKGEIITGDAAIIRADHEAEMLMADLGRLETGVKITIGRDDKDGNVRLKDLGSIAKCKLTDVLKCYRGFQALQSAQADGWITQVTIDMGDK